MVLLGRYTVGVTKVLVEAMIAEQVTVTSGAPALPPMRPRRQPDGEQRIGASGQLAQPGQHVGDLGLIHLGTRTRPAAPAPRPPQTERSPRPGGGAEQPAEAPAEGLGAGRFFLNLWLDVQSTPLRWRL